MVEITLYNTATRAKERFTPIDPDNVRMYVCGPTVYDRAHIGNARAVVAFDLLYRMLRHIYGPEHVTYVRNVTDVDDKINARAAERGVDISTVTDETLNWFHEDMTSIGALPPTHEPRATQWITQMIAMAEQLIASNNAYAAEGHVLFAVKGFDDYGALSRRSVDDMIAGARVEVAPYKRDPMDFVLWKPSSAAEPGWDSPWGRGRPGWHLECSAMSYELLGESFDIHGGGIDLVFPHHENERAQSLCAHPKGDFARVWMHNGFVQVEGEKMSKSLGNFITVNDLRDSAPGEVIRLALLSAQYRQPLDWTQALAIEMRTVLTRWRQVAAEANGEALTEPPEAVTAALADDLNSPKAIAEMHRLASKGDAAGLRAAGALLGLLTPELGGWEAAPEATTEIAALIEAALAARMAARKAKDFAAADRLRDGLIAAGVEIKDTPQGAEWVLKPEFDAGKLPEAST
ncbi:MAG: cysteine--tRNA ligase [Rhodobacteraceae bacterium]|nr:cysteine--tRNA ligase [Paracoccaceae bacterium]